MPVAEITVAVRGLDDPAAVRRLLDERYLYRLFPDNEALFVAVIDHVPQRGGYPQ